MPHLTRRTFLAATAAMPFATAAQGCTPGACGIDALAQTKGLRFGMMATMRAIADPRCAALIRRESGIGGPCNTMTWRRSNPDGPVADYTDSDSYADFVLSGGMGLRGVNVVWDKQRPLPAWVRDGNWKTASQWANVVANRANDLVTHFRGKVGIWDVVNEAIRPNSGRPVGGPLYQRLGWDFADIAFHAAHEADPAARLLYVDYVLPDRPAQQRGVLELLERLVARGVPVHGLGIQGHLWSDPSNAQFADWQRFLGDVAAMGLELHVTELDVIDNGLPGDVAERDRLAGERVRRFLDVTLAEPALREVRTWGVSDRYEGVSGMNPRADGLRRRSCPFDEAMQPKPIYHAIRAAIEAAPER